MTYYRITQDLTAINLGTYEADSEEEALDAYARCAGYASYAAVPEGIGGGCSLIISERRANCLASALVIADASAHDLASMLDIELGALAPFITGEEEAPARLLMSVERALRVSIVR